MVVHVWFLAVALSASPALAFGRGGAVRGFHAGPGGFYSGGMARGVAVGPWGNVAAGGSRGGAIATPWGGAAVSGYRGGVAFRATGRAVTVDGACRGCCGRGIGARKRLPSAATAYGRLLSFLAKPDSNSRSGADASKPGASFTAAAIIVPSGPRKKSSPPSGRRGRA